jgi:ADP-ribose pyrophosphatase
MSEPTPLEPQRKIIYHGTKIDLALQSVRLSDGSVKEREVVLHPGSVALVPMVDHDHVCLLKNFRHSANTTLIEIPAGTVDPGESPDVTAPRELAEETGYRAGKITRLTDWWVSPGVCTERMVLYLCEELTLGATDHQPDEQIEPWIVPWEEAIAMVLDGRIIDAKTIAGLLLCDRLRNGR